MEGRGGRKGENDRGESESVVVMAEEAMARGICGNGGCH